MPEQGTRGRAQNRAKVAGGQKHETSYEAKKTSTSQSEVRRRQQGRQLPRQGRGQDEEVNRARGYERIVSAKAMATKTEIEDGERVGVLLRRGYADEWVLGTMRDCREMKVKLDEDPLACRGLHLRARRRPRRSRRCVPQASPPNADRRRATFWRQGRSLLSDAYAPRTTKCSSHH